MDAQLKAKWVEALRSGKYRQGQNYLKKDGAFCCLGVLCDLSKSGEWEDDEVAGCHRYTVNGGWNRATLPSEIIAQFNVLGTGALIAMNDSGESFQKIASYIEANL